MGVGDVAKPIFPCHLLAKRQEDWIITVFVFDAGHFGIAFNDFLDHLGILSRKGRCQNHSVQRTVPIRVSVLDQRRILSQRDLHQLERSSQKYQPVQQVLRRFVVSAVVSTCLRLGHNCNILRVRRRERETLASQQFHLLPEFVKQVAAHFSSTENVGHRHQTWNALQVRLPQCSQRRVAVFVRALHQHIAVLFDDHPGDVDHGVAAACAMQGRATKRVPQQHVLRRHVLEHRVGFPL
mmetsp:Transcript_23805/g.67334  ORF Transcript_23805/g.67334 Transcript_23805/m.67334 type:complete len:238 (+) Transcript_23805:276-989(+)